MGFCHYQYNPSELYRRTKPGTAPETTCGGRTFPAMDEPEVVVVRTGMGPDGAVYEYRPTGRSMARAQDDPFCPGHGGSPPPPPPAVTVAELEQAYTAYQELMSRYTAQPGAVPAAAGPVPGALTAPPPPAITAVSLAPPPAAAAAGVSARDVAQAKATLQDLITRAEHEVTQ